MFIFQSATGDLVRRERLCCFGFLLDPDLTNTMDLDTGVCEFIRFVLLIIPYRYFAMTVNT